MLNNAEKTRLKLQMRKYLCVGFVVLVFVLVLLWKMVL